MSKFRRFAQCFLIAIFALCLRTSMFAAAVPFLTLPLEPAATAPGSPAFQLTVQGTGFVSGAVVQWNGHARTTTFVSGSQLSASIFANDVANAGTASVTVSNPGGKASNTVFLQVVHPSAEVGWYPAVGMFSESAMAADFNRDGLMDLATTGNNEVDIWLGNGDGTFRPPVGYSLGCARFVIAADFNGDGYLNLGVSTYQLDLSPTFVLLGNGDGTFQPPVQVGWGEFGIVAGDFNGDGNLDLASNDGLNYIMLGHGDGTFDPPVSHEYCGGATDQAIGDLNGDGKLDLVMNCNGGVSILFGNGDGTFRSRHDYSFPGTSIQVADFNGDGKLDLATAAGVMLGNGDGTFQAPVLFKNVEGFLTSIAVGDFNGDGTLDVATIGSVTPYADYVSNHISLMLGNGDGTFQPATNYIATSYVFGGPYASGIVAGDFNGDGRLDIGNPVMLYTPILLSPDSLSYGNQPVRTSSAAKSVHVKNIGAAPVPVSLEITADFTQTNDCEPSIAAHGSCTIEVIFTPSGRYGRAGTLTINESSSGSLHTVNAALFGTGIPPTRILSLSSTSFAYYTRLVGQVSGKRNLTVTNKGSGTLHLRKIALAGANSGDFLLGNNTCSLTLDAHASCGIEVFFKPTTAGPRSASLDFTDDAPGSPQRVALSGTGTFVDVSTNEVNFGDQRVGIKSAEQRVIVTNTGNSALNIASIKLGGLQPRDFSESNTCGVSLAAHQSCAVSITFTPTVAGPRQAKVVITDSDGGSPQAIFVFGAGV